MTRQPVDLPKHLTILLILGLQVFPVYMMAQISFKDNAEFLSNPWLPNALSDWKWANWLFAGKLIWPYVANTVFVAVLGTVGSLVLAVMGAYFFARHRMPGSGVLWAAFLTLMLMPTVANLVPLFVLLKDLSLLNTLWALILVSMAGTQVFNIYVLRNFIEELPRDLLEAAEIDGATHGQQLRNVIVPMSMPIIGTLAITTFLGIWNEFLLPLVVLRDRDLFTIGVGLVYLEGEYVKDWGQVMATFSLASLPLVVLFLFTMKWFVRGLSSGAIKG